MGDEEYNERGTGESHQMLARVVSAQHVAARVVAVHEVKRDHRYPERQDQRSQQEIFTARQAPQQERQIEHAHTAYHVEQQQGECGVATAH